MPTLMIQNWVGGSPCKDVLGFLGGFAVDWTLVVRILHLRPFDWLTAKNTSPSGQLALEHRSERALAGLLEPCLLLAHGHRPTPLGLKALRTERAECSVCALARHAEVVCPESESWQVPQVRAVQKSLQKNMISKNNSMGIVVDNEVFYFLKCLFTFCFWLCWVFMAVHGLSLVSVRKGYSSYQSTGSRHTGFSRCGSWSLERGLSSCGSPV